MSGQAVLSYIINRASIDPEFRQALAKAPRMALLPLGIELTDAQVKAIESMNNKVFKEHLEALGHAFGVDPVAFN